MSTQKHSLTEEQIIQEARMLLHDNQSLRWSDRYLSRLFSIGLSKMHLARRKRYKEDLANALITFVVNCAEEKTGLPMLADIEFFELPRGGVLQCQDQ